MSLTTIAKVNDAGTKSQRLIDLDMNKRTLTKQVIVFGAPGSGTEVVAVALKQMGFMVYDAAEAAKNYARDLPLWREAAELKKAGTPYSGIDFDNLVGNYQAIVGAPGTYLAQDLAQAYPNAKYIVLTKTPDAAVVAKYRSYAKNPVLSLIDPDFFGNVGSFLDIVYKDVLDLGMIRSCVQPQNLLEIETLDSFKTLCDFLEKPVIMASLPEVHQDAFTDALKKRATYIACRLGKDLIHILNCCAMAASVTTAGFTYGRPLFGNIMAVSNVVGTAFVLLVVARGIMTAKEIKSVDPEPATTTASPKLDELAVDLFVVPASAYVPPHMRPKPVIPTSGLPQPHQSTPVSVTPHLRKSSTLPPAPSAQPKKSPSPTMARNARGGNSTGIRQQARSQYGNQHQNRNKQGGNQRGRNKQGNGQCDRSRNGREQQNRAEQHLHTRNQSASSSSSSKTVSTTSTAGSSTTTSTASTASSSVAAPAARSSAGQRPVLTGAWGANFYNTIKQDDHEVVTASRARVDAQKVSDTMFNEIYRNKKY